MPAHRIRRLAVIAVAAVTLTVAGCGNTDSWVKAHPSDGWPAQYGDAANSSYKLIQALDPDCEIVGPVQMGLNKPIHFTDFECSVRDVVNITAVAVIDAYVQKIKENRL